MKLQVGRVEIAALTDLDVPIPMKLEQIWPGVPLTEWEPYRARFPHTFWGDDAWHNHVGCFLVRTGNDVVLVDTGIGAQPLGAAGPAGALSDELSGQGIAPADITLVFMTHLHLDHVGWNIASDGTPTFRRARYVMSRAEWDARPDHTARATGLGQPPYIDRCVTPLDALGVLQLLDGEHALTNELTAVPTPGHSPGHMSVMIDSGGERAMILGDVLLHPAQVSEPGWSSRMDMDPERAAETRRRVLDRAVAESLTLAAGHIRQAPFGRVVQEQRRRVWSDLGE